MSDQPQGHNAHVAKPGRLTPDISTRGEPQGRTRRPVGA